MAATRVCAHLQHHRSVLEPVRLGAVSIHQGRRQAERRERAGHVDLRSRCLLRDGCAAGVFGSHRPHHRCDLGSTRDAQWALVGKEVTQTPSAHSTPGPGVELDAGVPDQQHGAVGVDHLRALQEPPAGRAVLQVDQATPAHQACPGHQRERGEDSGVTRRRHLRPHRHRQEGASQLDASLYKCLQILSVSVVEKTQPSCALQADSFRLEPPTDSNHSISLTFDRTVVATENGQGQ